MKIPMDLPTDDLAMLAKLHRAHNDTLEMAVRQDKHKIKCSEGCRQGACCYVPVIIPLLEGLHLVGSLNDVTDHVDKLLAELTWLKDHPTFTGNEYLAARRPCVHLDVEKARCMSYDARPLVCRQVNVLTDPAKCLTGPTKTILFPQLDVALANLCNQADHKLGGSLVGVAPLTLMEALSLRLFHPDKNIRAKFAGMTSPSGWRSLGGDKILEESAKKIRDSRGLT